MLSNIKERLCLSKWHTTSENICYRYKELSKIRINSFIGYDKVLISHKDIPNVELQFPIQTPLNFDMNYLEEEIRRFSSIHNYAPFVKSKYRKRRMIIYQNNPMLVALLDYLISLNNYTEYHIFSGSNESYNMCKCLEKKHKWIRLNDVETNLSSMFRITRNDYDEIYNDLERNLNDHRIIFFSKENSIQEICCALQWLREFYISMPSNRFLVLFLNYIYRDYHKIDIVSNNDGYMLLYVSSVSARIPTMLTHINKLTKWYKEQRKEIKSLYTKNKQFVYNLWNYNKKALFPMKYSGEQD